MKTTKKKKKKKGLRTVLIILMALMAIIALGIALYPVISNLWNERVKSVVRTQYEETVEEMDESKRNQLLALGEFYNARLLASHYGAYTRESIQEAEALHYFDMLNLRDDGVMGYIEIPKIGVNEPILHGTSGEALDNGSGHLIGTSLPVGGVGMHSAISGHTGMITDKMFTDLEKLEIGDVFFVRILGRNMAYQIRDRNIVEPSDGSLLVPNVDLDSCTLITCTPYGINSHRLLLRGDRIAYTEGLAIAEDQGYNTGGSTWLSMYMKGIIYGLIAIVALLIIVLTIRLIKRIIKRQKEKYRENQTTKEKG